MAGGMSRIVLHLTVIALLTVIAAVPASAAGAAADYPSKTIGFPTHPGPGGGMDILGRHLTEALKAQKISAVVENRSGSGRPRARRTRS